jgi:hypothetical protein
MGGRRAVCVARFTSGVPFLSWQTLHRDNLFAWGDL